MPFDDTGSFEEVTPSGMIIKDASAYNIQWYNNGRLILSTHSPLKNTNEEEPRIAYRQFCEHFLGLLLLMHYRKPLAERG